MPGQKQKSRPVGPVPLGPVPLGGGGGPASPKIKKPNTAAILKKLRKVQSNQAKKFRQRSGE